MNQLGGLAILSSALPWSFWSHWTHWTFWDMVIAFPPHGFRDGVFLLWITPTLAFLQELRHLIWLCYFFALFAWTSFGSFQRLCFCPCSDQSLSPVAHLLSLNEDLKTADMAQVPLLAVLSCAWSLEIGLSSQTQSSQRHSRLSLFPFRIVKETS